MVMILPHFPFLYVIFVRLCHAQELAPQALNVPPSGQWDGFDGPWSTFNLGVGEPLQPFRCLPGLNLPVAIVPANLGWPSSRTCRNLTATSPCRERTTFDYDKSTTYNATGIYNATNYFEFEGFDLLDRRQWVVGRDTIRLGHSDIQDQAFPSQYVYGVDSPDYSLGMFGLAAGLVSARITGSTLFSAMVGQFAIPSLSFGYTAGSAAANTTGSLVLGGYDTARFGASTTLYANMPSKNNYTLVVGVHAIHLNLHEQTEATWRPPSDIRTISFRITSILAQIWLPPDACAVFEKTFGLMWNSTVQYYILDKTKRAALMTQNPSVTFSLSNGTDPTGEQKNFTLPYSAFDLQLLPPLVNESFYYFPLKRAENPMQYVFGRAFLQETYITIDYGRASFSLSQAFPNGGSGYIVPVYNATNGTAYSSEKLSDGEYAGIGIGAGIAAVIVASILFSWKRRWGPFRRKIVVGQDAVVKPELHNDDIPRVEAMEKERAELPDRERVEAMERERGELETVEPRHEAGGLVSIHELDGHPF